MSFPLTADSEMIQECDNCGSEDHLFSNSSGDLWCESCGWSEDE